MTWVSETFPRVVMYVHVLFYVSRFSSEAGAGLGAGYWMPDSKVGSPRRDESLAS